MRQKAQQFLTEALGIILPYHPMGKIDSLDLFGPTELMILQLYKHNQFRWKRALDIGANLGLHSILMAKLGWMVEAYEPDPDIYQRLVSNINANKMQGRISSHEAAVHATKLHKMKFVRVHNNLTGSHLEGFKDSYGPRDTIVVKTVNSAGLWKYFDFAKIDSEGNEHELVSSMTSSDMQHLSCIIEVRNEKNAQVIWEHFKNLEVPMWPQKIDWAKAQSLEDLPKQNREGSLFVGLDPPW